MNSPQKTGKVANVNDRDESVESSRLIGLVMYRNVNR